MTMNPTARVILSHLEWRQRNRMTMRPRIIADCVGIGYRTVYRCLLDLRALGFIDAEPPARGSPYVIKVRPEGIRALEEWL